MAGENGEIEYGGTQKIKTNQINHLKILFLYIIKELHLMKF